MYSPDAIDCLHPHACDGRRLGIYALSHDPVSLPQFLSYGLDPGRQTLGYINTVAATLVQVDLDALEIVHLAIDHELARGAVQTLPAREDPACRRIRLLDLFEFERRLDTHELRVSWIAPDGRVWRIGATVPLTTLFDNGRWLRFAFHRWAPMFRCPAIEIWHDRPPSIQLDTERVLERRLRVDRRYSALQDELRLALGYSRMVWFALELISQRRPSWRPAPQSRLLGVLARREARLHRSIKPTRPALPPLL